jgi:hypothetical protein
MSTFEMSIHEFDKRFISAHDLDQSWYVVLWASAPLSLTNEKRERSEKGWNWTDHDIQ